MRKPTPTPTNADLAEMAHKLVLSIGLLDCRNMSRRDTLDWIVYDAADLAWHLDWVDQQFKDVLAFERGSCRCPDLKTPCPTCISENALEEVPQP